LLGDFDLAEEAMHEAFALRSGVPGNPRPWLISTARFKAIDTLRRRARLDRIAPIAQIALEVCVTFLNYSN
jgi:RNA polymerase sigma-70 factor (ECF subfamily)